MDEDLKKYRQHLVDTLQKVSESYDKTVIALSGGALGISFTFVKDFIGENQAQNPEILFLSWALLSVSLATVLFSLFFGTLAFRKAISQVDDGTIYDNPPGGGLGKATIYLHSSGAIFLILGLFLLGCFVFTNLGDKNDAQKTNPAASTSSKSASAANSRAGSGEDSSRPTSAAASTKP